MSKATKAKNVAIAQPPVKEEPPTQPHLVITESVASDFMKEINATLPEAMPPKQNEFIEKLVNAVKAPKDVAANPAKPAKAVAPPKAPKPVEDPAEKANLIAKITLNANSFESLLQDFLKPSKAAYLEALPKKSVAELTILLKTLEHTRAVGNSTNQMKHLVFLGASAVEIASQRVGMRTQGYAQALRAQEDEIRMILQEIAIERADTLTKYQRPEIRLALILSTTLLAMDNNNRLKELQAATGSQKISQDAEATYKDL